MQLVLSMSPKKILTTLMIDEKNIDGTVLQLATFVVKDFFHSHERKVEFEKIQPLTASILQAVFEPFIGQVKKAFLKQEDEEEETESTETDTPQ